MDQLTQRMLAVTASKEAARRDIDLGKNTLPIDVYRLMCSNGHMVAAEAWTGISLEMVILEAVTAHNFIDHECDAPTQRAGELIQELKKANLLPDGLMTCFVCGDVVPEGKMLHGVHLREWDDLESVCLKDRCRGRIDMSRAAE